MKVGLINIEPKINNTAYMQIAHHHRSKGDSVEWYDSDKEYDKIYCSSLFTFTDKSNVPPEAVCGGTGYDLTTTLPFDCDLDYSLYPACDCSYIWFSRGCVRNCGFCCVRQKEGAIRPVEPKNLNPNGKYIQVQDNNYFANPAWKRNKWKLWSFNQPVDFQGIDVRLLTREMCEFLRYTRLHGQLKIAWDRFADKHVVLDKIKMLLRYVSRSKIRCYVLVGYKSTERQDLQRLRTLHQIGIDPYVMCMDRKNSLYQRKIQKWNNGFAFRKVKWEDFELEKCNKKTKSILT